MSWLTCVLHLAVSSMHSYSISAGNHSQIATASKWLIFLFEFADFGWSLVFPSYFPFPIYRKLHMTCRDQNLHPRSRTERTPERHSCYWSLICVLSSLSVPFSCSGSFSPFVLCPGFNACSPGRLHQSCSSAASTLPPLSPLTYPIRL